MKNLLKSLAGFQSECPAILESDTATVKTDKGYSYSYSYSSLSTIIDTINPILQKYGLTYFQTFNKDSIITTLAHIESGETITSELSIPTIEGGKMNVYQNLGAGITYLRRYSLSALLGIVTEKDTDGVTDHKPANQTKQVNQSDVLVQWQNEINKQKSIDELNKFYKSNAQAIAGNEAILEMFANRKSQLQ